MTDARKLDAELQHLGRTAAELLSALMPEGTAFVLHVLPACSDPRQGRAYMVAHGVCTTHQAQTLQQALRALLAMGAEGGALARPPEGRA